MISLLLSMVRARRAQSITIFLLAAVATAAAVAGPVALAAVDHAIARAEVAAATNIERSLSVTAFVNPSQQQTSAQFDTIAALLKLPGFETVRAGELEAFGPVADGNEAFGTPTSRIVFRDRVCEHITIVTGRCLAGPLEIIVGEDTARRAGLRAGDISVIQAARYVEGRGLIPDGAEARVTVVGVYRATDFSEVYWAGQRYFPVTTDGTRREAVFTTVLTFDTVEHSLGQSSVDSLAQPGTLTVDRLTDLRAEVEDTLEPLADDPGYAIETDLPILADRVEESRRAARQLVPVAFVPLIAISFFVIFLAVGYGIFGRRQELGVVTLRGVKPLRRWWIATGETTTVILAAAPLGYLLGHWAVTAVAVWQLGGAEGTQPSLATLPYAALALLGTIGVALLGQRRTLAEPVVELLRGVPRTGAGWRSIVIEAVVLVLAVLGAVQLRTAGVGGVALLVPGLIVVAVALVSARALAPAAGFVARVALRRGQLGAGLAAVHLARRPGSQRLLALLAAAAAMLAFVAAGIDVASRAREDRARIITGANNVLAVDQADARRLLHVTRQVDPQGTWAMAAMTLNQPEPGAPTLLAVDSARLATVAIWESEFGGSAASIAQALAPPPAKPFVFHSSQLELDLESFHSPELRPFDLNLSFAPLNGGDVISVQVKEVAFGRVVRHQGVFGCRDGCRLTGLSIATLPGDPVRLVLHSIRQTDPPGEVVPAAELIRRDRWRAATSVLVSSLGTGLQIVAEPSPFDGGESRVAAVDVRLPVPVIAAGKLGLSGTIVGLDNRPVGAGLAGEQAMLPRLASRGALVDLEYLERSSLDHPRRGQAEVWLGPAAPADAAERLRRAGLAISGSTGVASSRATLARQGPALALQFHLGAAILGVLLALGALGLVAAVDRRQRANDFRALRRQGLRMRSVFLAALGGYLSIVIAAALVGLGAAWLAWWIAGDRLPLFTDSLDALIPPRWPLWRSVVLPWSYAALAMVAAAAIAGFVLQRITARKSIAGNGGN